MNQTTQVDIAFGELLRTFRKRYLLTKNGLYIRLWRESRRALQISKRTIDRWEAGDLRTCPFDEIWRWLSYIFSEAEVDALKQSLQAIEPERIRQKISPN